MWQKDEHWQKTMITIDKSFLEEKFTGIEDHSSLFYTF